MRKVILLLCFIGFISCQTKQVKTNSVSTVHSKDLLKLEEAFKDMNEGHYRRAALVFESLVNKYEGHTFKWAAVYNLAGAYKKLGQCDKAKTLYQQLIKQSHFRIKAHSYLLLAYVYECLGDASSTLEILKAARPYMYVLSEEKRLIEYPARLALAYIRIGANHIGTDIQKQVHQNMEEIRKSSPVNAVIEQNFARYLYKMGESHIQPGKIELKKFLKMAVHYQFYLTQSVLLGASEWSLRAEKELKNIYQKIGMELKNQKNKTIYQKQLSKLLSYLKQMAQSENNKRMFLIYQEVYTDINRSIHLSKS